MSASYGSISPPTQRNAMGYRDETTAGRCSFRFQNTNIPVLVAAFLAAGATGGPTYAFGLYGSTLKTTLHLTQSELDTISSANFCAGLLSWIPGICVDRWGPKIAMATGGTLECLSLLAYWVAAHQFDVLQSPHSIVVPTLSALGVLIFMSNSLVIGSLFKAIVVSPGSKGPAVGAAKGFVGLGAGIYSCLFDAVRGRNESDLDFLLLAAALALLAIVAPALLFLPSKENMATTVVDISTPLHYRTVYFGLMALALFVVGTSAMFLFRPLPQDVEDVASSSEQGPHYQRGLLLLVAWFGPILALFLLPQSTPSIPPIRSKVAHYSAKDDEAEQEQASKPLVPTEPPPVQAVEDLSLTGMLRTIPAWLFLWTSMILVGSGTIMTNNMGQMVEALGFPSRAAAACLAMFSVAQAGARVAAGAISESALSWRTPVCGNDHGVPRPAFLVIASLFGVAAHTTLAAATSRKAFVTGVVLSGIAFGMVWPLMVLIVGEVFGTVNHGANYMFYDGFTSAIGTLMISKYIAQTVYESHIVPEDENMDEITCYGSDCFRLSHVITAALCLTSTLTSVGVLYTTRTAYGRGLSDRQVDEELLYSSPYMSVRPKRAAMSP